MVDARAHLVSKVENDAGGIAGGRLEDHRRRLTEDVDVMLAEASASGTALTSALGRKMGQALEEGSEVPLADLFEFHSALLRVVAPATPDTIRASRRIKFGNRSIVTLTLVSLALFLSGNLWTAVTSDESAAESSVDDGAPSANPVAGEEG